jgi:aquaporin Z
MTKRMGAEFFGTLWLVLGGCGSAVLAAAYPQLGIGFVGVSLAFGLTVLRWPTRSATSRAAT